MSALAVMSCLLAAPALGQTMPDTSGASDARIQWGPLRVKPTIALTNFGVDSNVFNENDINHPKSDFTMTVTPAAETWLRLGRATVTAGLKEDLVYYQQFASERSVNEFYRAAVVVPFNRLSVFAGADYLSARDRPGYEIDARSQHDEAGAQGGLEVRAFGKTFVGASVRHAHVEFAQDSVFLGTSLQRELSRVTTSAGVTVRHQLTPVTAVTMDVRRDQDRFDYAVDRDSNSTRVMGGLKFDTRLRGTASIGYRSFTALEADVPGYGGLAANADVSFATVGATRIGVQVLRDLEYSYDFQQPYYIQTGAVLSYTQGLFGPLNGSVRAGLYQLDYRGRIGVVQPLANRTDVVSLFGGSVGYRVQGDMRVLFNVDKQERNSDLAGHSYGGLRFGTSVTYGF
jgi:hypothetical protein